MAQPQSQPVVAEVVRSGIVEGHHYGAVVALAPDGSVDWAVGDVERPVLPRSCVKPLQAVGMLRCGLDLPDELLALVCASHSGEPFHVEGVRRILRGAGLSEASLQTPADLPLGDVARAELLRGGGSAAPVLMNCSGKHAGMLATCVARGWDTGTYLSPEHPLQRAILQTVVSLTGDQTPLHGPGALAVDGCGAPAPATSLVGLARAFGLLARGLDGS
ncbi:MAG TPA: asparaginase, partial [Nocardioides sp.]|uniref:asparaginase n=1 Tax=Nocardioides sp. TaxID=35761 RepID=UPI002C5A09C0